MPDGADRLAVFVVCKVSPMQSYQTLSILYESANVLEATDVAFEVVDEHEPEALEIQRTRAEERETVWTDPTRWDGQRSP